MSGVNPCVDTYITSSVLACLLQSDIDQTFERNKCVYGGWHDILINLCMCLWHVLYFVNVLPVNWLV